MPSQGEPIDDDASPDLLEGVDLQHAQLLCRSFDIMASKIPGLNNSSALWALATLLAQILAAPGTNDDIMNATGERFARMLRLAYPAMVRTMETARREAQGLPLNDA